MNIKDFPFKYVTDGKIDLAKVIADDAMINDHILIRGLLHVVKEMRAEIDALKGGINETKVETDETTMTQMAESIIDLQDRMTVLDGLLHKKPQAPIPLDSIGPKPISANYQTAEGKFNPGAYNKALKEWRERGGKD